MLQSVPEPKDAPDMDQDIVLTDEERDSIEQFFPGDPKKHQAFAKVLKGILPLVGRDEVKIILAEVMLALKIEGVVGKRLSDADAKMVQAIKDSIMLMPEKKEEALLIAQKFLNPG